MREFAPYADYLTSLACDKAIGPETFDFVDAALDGESSRTLRKVVSVPSLRADGAFFSGHKLAETLVQMSKGEDTFIHYFDPACGTGDLLLASAARLPLLATLSSTLRDWGQRLGGCDKHSVFVQSAKARLVLMAKKRLNCWKKVNPSEYFPLISTSDGLVVEPSSTQKICILMNPPFYQAIVPKECDWTSGSATIAAQFVHRYASILRAGAQICAILPEVLRSGTRYEKWRNQIGSLAEIRCVKQKGQFAPWADIDVFMLRLQVRASSNHMYQWPRTSIRSGKTLGDDYRLAVGTVVPHRHSELGPEYLYAKASPSAVPPWKTIDSFEAKRRFTGTVFTPPFVLIRRTSRPGDRHRAVATIVKGDQQVAVENHLIVAMPKDGTIAACVRLMKQLKTIETTRWLDRRICCRHLTIRILAEMPIN